MKRFWITKVVIAATSVDIFRMIQFPYRIIEPGRTPLCVLQVIAISKIRIAGLSVDEMDLVHNQSLSGVWDFPFPFVLVLYHGTVNLSRGIL